jgi:predicted AlkP superfamily phosphohydrolase/phosphomutase
VLVSSPKNIERELQKDYPNYKIDVDIPSQDYDKVEKQRILYEAYKIIETRTNLALELMKRYEWDFFYVVYTMTDRIQHIFWAYDENPELNQSNEYGGEINRLYKTMDSVTGRYLEEIDDETNVIVISDHGFEYIHSQFNIVNWMRNENWIHKQPRGSGRFNLLKRLYKKIGSTGLVDTTNLFESLPRVFKQVIINEKINHVPGGLILDMYDLSREDIDRQKILDVRDPENDARIVDNVYFREEIYHGEYAENAVDMLVQPKKGYIISTKSDGIINRIEYPFSNHISEDCRKGIFYAYGPMIQRNKIEMNCIDVTPTILWTLLGNETKLEGVIRREIFSEETDYKTKKLR